MPTRSPLRRMLTWLAGTLQHAIRKPSRQRPLGSASTAKVCLMEQCKGGSRFLQGAQWTQPNQRGGAPFTILGFYSKLLDGNDRETGHDPVLHRGEAVLVLQKSHKYSKHCDSKLTWIEVAFDRVSWARVDTCLTGTRAQRCHRWYKRLRSDLSRRCFADIGCQRSEPASAICRMLSIYRSHSNDRCRRAAEERDRTDGRPLTVPFVARKSSPWKPPADLWGQRPQSGQQMTEAPDQVCSDVTVLDETVLDALGHLQGYDAHDARAYPSDRSEGAVSRVRCRRISMGARSSRGSLVRFGAGCGDWSAISR